jgi:hypothetical protein
MICSLITTDGLGRTAVHQPGANRKDTLSGGSNERSECYFVCCSNSNERSECRFVCCSGVGQGSSERGERHFLCCSFVGELHHRGPQSALVKVGRTWDASLLASRLCAAPRVAGALWQHFRPLLPAYVNLCQEPLPPGLQPRSIREFTSLRRFPPGMNQLKSTSPVRKQNKSKPKQTKK